MMALITAGKAPTVPASPAPFTPKGFNFVDPGLLPTSIEHTSSARDMKWRSWRTGWTSSAVRRRAPDASTLSRRRCAGFRASRIALYTPIPRRGHMTDLHLT